MPIKFDMSKFANNSVFIETGTYNGYGVRDALAAGFNKIFSIELDKERYEVCKKMFENNSNVEIIYGDSGKVLPKLLENINESATFWIDAHYCADGAEIGDKWCPLDEELKAIHNHKIKTHTILIDDWRCMDNTHIDEKTGKDVGFLGKKNCLERIKEINPEYNISFLEGVQPEDVLCAKIVLD